MIANLAARFMTRKIGVVVTITLGLVVTIVIARQASMSILETTTFSTRIVDQEGKLLRLTLSGDEKYRLFTPIEEIPSGVVDEVLRREDRWFRSHPGVNPFSLAKAFVTTYVRQSRRMGGSTITMQLARMTSTRGSKTVAGKLHQIFRALWLEATHSKDEILEAYLNLLPYGGNIEGLGAASLVYFGKDVKDLGPLEIKSLAVVPQNPNRRSATEFGKPRRLPFHAPHFTNAVLDRSKARSKRDSSNLVSTLDLSLQFRLEAKLKAYVKAKSRIGVANAAAIVVDTTSMSVKAHVGSADFFDREIDGQVDGTFAKRSPGSALKPFTYALAIDQGLIHPMTLLKDTPTSFGAFDPENFDKGYVGPVHAREALTSSRNVPAVHLASKLREPSLYDFLKRGGMKLPKSADHYGLALTLGGAEVTMEELASLYSGLANKGVFRRLRYLRDEKSSEGVSLLSPEAAFLVLDMLRTNPRDDQKLLDGWTRDSVPIAWKTGTSYGFRDAWTAGVMGPYVIVVWLGDFEGRSNPSLIGRDLAAPLFFQIADGLRRESDKEPAWLDTRDLNLRKVKVCSLSGHLPGEHCRHHAQTLFIPAKSPITKCDIHRQVKVAANGLRVCDETRADVTKQVVEFWPSDLLQLFRQAGLPRKSPPAFEPGCRVNQAVTGLPPQITSPRQSVSYSLRVEGDRDPASKSEGVPLAATADADVRTLHWFIDSKYVGESAPQRTIMWQPKPGRFTVRVVDDLGRSDSRPLEVEITR